ncbi:hypothetical protein EV175_005679, partial [Coemansia sp. RSA 1933]
RLKMVAPAAKAIDIVYDSNYIIADTQFGALFQKFIKEVESAVYPVLKKLVIEPIPYQSQIISKQMFPDFVPFPKLEHLDIQTVYPFADDVMFRGNTETLEHLALHYDKQLALIFCGSETFSNGQYSSLKRVHVRSVLESIKAKQQTASMPNNSIMAQFFLDIMPSVQWLKIDAPEVASALVGSISKDNIYVNVELLDLNHEINAGEVVRLLKSMPSLSHLVSKFSGIGKKFKDLSLEELVENMSSRQERLGESMFRKWSIRGIGSESDFESIATSAFLLAVGCAKFKSIPMEKESAAAYNDALHVIAGSVNSDEHKDTAKRLLVSAV